VYAHQRPVSPGATTASTPETWAALFAASTRLGRRKRLRLSLMREARLIRRYVPRGSTILDAGCGFGEWVVLLRDAGYDAIGVDYSPELIRRLRQTYPDRAWVQADIRSLPYPPGTMDSVISWGVVEHDEAGPGAALREFHRVLRPGGVAIVSVPLDSPAARRAAVVQKGGPAGAHAFYQYLLSSDELRAEMTAAGFEVLELGTRTSMRLGGLALRLANFAVYALLSWMRRYRVMLYVVARTPPAPARP
jgi:SAM-dependent methyltransferase